MRIYDVYENQKMNRLSICESALRIMGNNEGNSPSKLILPAIKQT